MPLRKLKTDNTLKKLAEMEVATSPVVSHWKQVV